MKKALSRMISMLLVVLMVFSLMPVLEIDASAANGDDIARYAESQIEKKYSYYRDNISDMLYDNWCAWFVTYCANSVGLGGTNSNHTSGLFAPLDRSTWGKTSPAWGATGVPEMANWMTANNKGTVYYFTTCDSCSLNGNWVCSDRSSFEPKRGDIVFLYGWEHVAIVTGYNKSNGVVSWIGGNEAGNNSSWYTTSKVQQNSWCQRTSDKIVAYCRPNYITTTGYLTKCSAITETSAQVEITTKCPLWSLPCYSSTDPASTQKIKDLAVGTKLYVTGYLTNTENHIWYRVKYSDGNSYWLYSDRAKFVKYVPTISWSGLDYPKGHYDSLPVFRMYGQINTADNTKIGNVKAWVVSSNGNKYFTDATEYVNDTSYEIRKNNVDNKLVFGNLPSGNYSIYITAKEIINRFPGEDPYDVTRDLISGGAAFSIGATSRKIEDCSSPSISTTDIDGGKRVDIRKGSSADGINYTIQDSTGFTVTTGLSEGSYNCMGEGTWMINVTEFQAGYNSVTKKQTVTVSRVAMPNITYDQTAAGTIVTIKTGTSGAAVYYTTSGNNPYIGNQDTKLYNGQIILGNEDVTVKAIAVKKGSKDSAVASQFIETIVPSTPVVKLATPVKSPIGDVATFNWGADKKTGHYEITLYKDGNIIKQESITENSYSFIPETAGHYEIKVVGVNDLGYGEMSSAVGFDAMNPCTVRFVDWDGTLISEQTVKYGSSAAKPASPSRRGYTFDGWGSTGYSRVTEDIELQAEYEINRYTVSFYSANGALLSKQTVVFDTSASAPEPPAPAIGYVFAGWATTSVSDESSNCDYTHVDADMSLTAVYAWENEDLPVVAQIDSAVRSAATNNYKIGVSLYNAPNDNTTALLRVSLKASNGKLLMTSRTTVELLQGGNGSAVVTMKYSGEATYAEVMVIGFDGDEKTGGTYSKAVQSRIIDESDWVWGPWSDWQTEMPQESANTDIEAQKQYCMRTKEYMTSTESKMPEWTQWEQYDTTVTYGTWSGYGDAKITPSDTLEVGTRSIQVSPASQSYTYGAYFSSNSSKPYAWTHFCPTCANWSYGGTWTYKTYTQNNRATASSLGQSCGHKGYFGTQYRANDGYLYYYETVNTTPATYKTQYRSRSITTTYSFWRWGSWSEWTDCDSNFDATSTADTQYDTRVLYRTRDKVFGQTGELEDTTGNTYSISGSLSLEKDFSGRIATVFVYNSKNTDPNVDQIQYIGQITIGEGNSYDFSFVPKTEPTSETGDFLVALAFEGGTELLNIDIIKAPKSEYKVIYIDNDGTVISEQLVESGANAQPPEAPAHDGMRFTTWSASSVNVRSDMIIVAQYDATPVVIAFADWVNQTVTIQNYNFGDVIVAPDAPEAEGKIFVGWDKMLDGELTAIESTVITAVYEDKEYSVTFLGADGEPYDNQTVKYGMAAQPPEAPETEDMVFLGWSDENTWWEVKSDMTVAPILAYKYTVAAPAFDIIDDNGRIFITMESATDDAVIYYSFDGSNPLEYGETCNGCVEIPVTTTEVTPNYDSDNEYVSATVKYEIAVIAMAVADNMNNSEPVNIHYNGEYVSYPAMEETTDFASITIENCEANKDNTADVVMRVGDCGTITGWTVELVFNKDILSLTEVAADNDYCADFDVSETDTGARIVFYPGNAIDEAEARFVLKFKLADSTGIGDYSVSVDEENSEVLNSSGDSMPIIGNDGIIFVRDFNLLSIRSNPSSTYVHLGETAEFKVLAYGNNLSYRWETSQDDGETWKNTLLAGYKTDTLSVEAKSYREGYQFRCVVTDGEGNSLTSEPAALLLKPCEAVIISQPVDFAGVSREKASFTVVAEGENLKYQWYFSNDGGNKWGKSFAKGSTTSIFEPNLYADISGRYYRCEITDKYGQTMYTDPAKMYVAYSEIGISQQPEDYTGKANELAQFTVTAEAVNLEYEWEVSMDGGETWARSTNEGWASETLNVRLYAYRDGYMYRCKLTSGSPYDAENSVVVYSEPATIHKVAQTVKITSNPETAYCEAGDTAVFTVGAVGDGLTYQWQYSTTGGETWGNSGMAGADTPTLNVKATAARNGQMYRCRITDESGSFEVSAIVTLRVGTLPVIVSQPENYIGSVDSNAVFSVNAEGEGLTYQWYYRTSENSGWAASGQADAKTDALTVTVKGYRDGYQYYCEITNADGMRVTTNVVTLEVGEVMHVHNYGEWYTITEVSCTEDGEERCYCDECDKYQSRIIPRIGHDYSSSITTVLSCTTDGVITYTCARCGDTYDEITAAKGHTVVVDAELPATCTKTGLTEGSHCDVCGEIIAKQDEIPKIDHSYVDGYCEYCGRQEGAKLIASGTCEENVTWEFYDDGLLRIFPSEPGIEASIADSSDYNTLPWGDFKDRIVSVDIAQGITAIGRYAFYGCTKLESVNIPEGVTIIGTNSFYHCSLNSVCIPDTVTAINGSAFSGCKSLSSIELPDNLSYLGSYAFYNCSNLKLITIPESVTYLGNYAFASCSSLTKAEVEASIFSIPEYLFYKCSNLNEVSLPAGITNIERYAFNGCKKLTDMYYSGPEMSWNKVEIASYNEPISNAEIHFNESATIAVSGTCDGNISWSVDINGLLRIYLTNDEQSGSIPDFTVAKTPWYDYRNDILSVEIADGITGIGTYCMYKCANLASVTLPSSIETIGANAFSLCKQLESLEIPDRVRSIGGNAFYNCTGLKEINIPYGVEAIDAYTFYECENLERVVIPDSVTSILKSSFYDCSKLAVVEGAENVESIGSYAFYGCTILPVAPINDNLSSLGSYAFCRCDSLKEVDIPAGLSEIGTGAFASCHNLVSATISEGVTSISKSAFSNCTSLTSIILPEGITEIGNSVFNACTGLSTIIIPTSVTTIADEAFAGCTGLKEIYYDGTKFEWNSISVGRENEPLQNAVIHWNTDEGVAVSGTRDGNIAWSISNDCVLSIRPDNPNKVANIVDETYDSPWKQYVKLINSVEIENGIQTIGRNAFYRLVNVESVTIPNTVTTIGYQAFDGCTSIETIIVPKNVTLIDICAFKNCTTLESIEIPERVNQIGWSAFEGCTNLKSVTLPQGIEAISKYVFQNCSFEKIEIPNGVMIISSSAFLGCSNLREITIPNSVTRISSNAFSDCTALMDVYYHGTESEWGETVSITGNDSLLNAEIHYSDHNYIDGVCDICGKHEGITIIDKGECGENLTWTLERNGKLTISGSGNMTEYDYHLTGASMNNYTAAPWAYDRELIKSVVIEPGVTSIARYAFMDCTNLSSISIPDTIVAIPVGIFEYCTSLKEIDLPNSITTISQGFRGSGIEEIVIPSSVTSIVLEAFYNCSNLTKVTIPSSVTSIGYEAFEHCSSLTNVVFCGNAPTCNSNLFDDCAAEFKILAPDNDETWKGDAYDAEAQTWNGCPIEFYHPDTIGEC